MQGGERNQSRRPNLAAALFALIFFLNPHTGQAQETNAENGGQIFDGRWWAKAGSDERTGFLYALDDCLTFDAAPRLSFDDTWSNYEKNINNYYASSSLHSATLVQHVFEGYAKRSPTTGSTPPEERYGDEFWRAHHDLGRRGFLEGYMSCRAHYKRAPRWSKPIGYYFEKLNDMYNVDDRHGESAPEYNGSVASALEKLQD